MGDATMIRRNKKGAMVLRDIMFIVISFAIIMALASVLVRSMANEYSNTQMITDYDNSESVGNLGDTVFVNVSSSLESMKESTDQNNSLLGSFSSITGAISGAAEILGAILSFPKYIGSAISTMMVALSIPDPLPDLVKNAITYFIYVLIIFVIISALLKGGKV